MAATPAVPATAGVALTPIATWEVMSYEPEYGPPKPGACVDGWASHVWTISFDYGTWSLTCDCKLCADGFGESGAMESVVGEIPVRLSFDSDHGPEGKGRRTGHRAPHGDATRGAVVRRTLRVYKLEADLVDVSTTFGPSVVFGYVTVAMTDGEVTLTRRVIGHEEYQLGQSVEVEIEDDA